MIAQTNSYRNHIVHRTSHIVHLPWHDFTIAIKQTDQPLHIVHLTSYIVHIINFLILQYEKRKNSKEEFVSELF
jgi:hypothetical protein